MTEISPGAIFTHRSNVNSADGATPPAADSASWAINPGYAKARVYAYVDFTGGTSPYLVLRPWTRSKREGPTGKVGKAEAVTVSGDDQVAIDIQADGDDLLVFVESVAGSPTGLDVDLYLSWR